MLSAVYRSINHPEYEFNRDLALTGFCNILRPVILLVAEASDNNPGENFFNNKCFILMKNALPHLALTMLFALKVHHTAHRANVLQDQLHLLR